MPSTDGGVCVCVRACLCLRVPSRALTICSTLYSMQMFGNWTFGTLVFTVLVFTVTIKVCVCVCVCVSVCVCVRVREDDDIFRPLG